MKQLEFSNQASWDHFVELVHSVLATDGVALISHFAPDDNNTLLVRLANILNILPEKHRLTLQECRFPAPFGAVAILYLVGGNMRIRYNRLEVDRAASVAKVALTPRQCAALDSLDDAIEATQLRFHLKQAECLVMDNHRVLHGRTPLSPHSDRLLKRVRLSL